MGEPGAIKFLTEDGALYHANYYFDDLKWTTVKEAFPVITKCRFGICGEGSVVPSGWHYVNLGMGNHLIVRQDRYERFSQLVPENYRPSEMYGSWLNKALSVN